MKGDSDVQSPFRDGEVNVLCAGIGETSYGGACQFVLLDIMLWLYTGCFGDAARVVSMWKIGAGMCRAPLHEVVFGIFGMLGDVSDVSSQSCVFFAKPLTVVLFIGERMRYPFFIIACYRLLGLLDSLLCDLSA